jgi:uncharacterized protein
MTPTRFRFAVLLASLGLLAAGTLALARAVKSDDKVRVTASATKPDADGNQVVTLNLDVEKPWHLYANPVGLEGLEDSQVVVTVNAKEKPESVKVEYPEGKLVKDATVGDYRIYEGKVTIKAQVRRAKGDTSPLEVSIRVQTCTETKCLPRSTVQVTVP